MKKSLKWDDFSHINGPLLGKTFLKSVPYPGVGFGEPFEKLFCINATVRYI